jgi:hypothetical protein
MTIKHNIPSDRIHETQSIKGKLTLFFYLLIRDHLPVGKLLEMRREFKEVTDPAVFSSPGILEVAKEFVSDLLGDNKDELQADKFMLDTLQGYGTLVAALMERLDTHTVEFTDRQLCASDQSLLVQVENFHDRARGCHITKLVLKNRVPKSEVNENA